MKQKVLSIIILLLIPLNFLYAETEEDLYFTYAGLVFGGGIDNIKYKDWFPEDDRRETKNIKGNYQSGGIILNIFVHQLIGEFSIEYIKNSNDEVPVNHAISHAAGKYAYELSPLISITVGIGMYMETLPASRDYNAGGGGCASLGTVFSLSREIKILLDITARYGYFGIGEESTRYTYGGKLGAVYKVGRI